MFTYYPYLEDKIFLKQLAEDNNKQQLVKIQVLDYNTEMPLASLEGISTSGNVNLGDSAAVRRTFSGSVVVRPEGIYNEAYGSYIQYHNLTEVQNLISLNKKIKVEVGFVNNTEMYKNYEIIWLPLGIFIVKTASISENNSGINISLTCSDKAVTLNGEVEGVIPADTVFSELETHNAEGTERTIEKILIKNIIRNLVVEFGGEKPENILITDIPEYITKIVKWIGDKPLYYYNKTFSLESTGQKEEKVFTKGQDIGYQLAPFTYPGTLEAKTGESVASVLNKIKNALGNYEWFYDVHGRFIFQEKKNYIYNAPNIEDKMTSWLNLADTDFLSKESYLKSIYTFDNIIITSVSNAPQYNNIKNDFVIWGSSTTVTGKEQPIRYHVVFDKKPLVDENEIHPCIVYKDARKLWKAIYLNNNYELKCPTINSDRKKYYIDNNKIYFWEEEYKGFLERPDWEVCGLVCNDWRTKLYFLGLKQHGQTFTNNYYAAELNAEWPKLYNIKAIDTGKTTQVIEGVSGKVYKGDFVDMEGNAIDPSNYEFGLDFLEGDQGILSENISQFNVNNIGRRTKVISDQLINCIYPIEIPNIAIIEADGDVEEERKQLEAMKKEWTQVSKEINKNISIGGEQSSAYDLSKELLTIHTQYNEVVNFNTIPVFHLEPNQRITINNSNVDVRGDYLIKSISLPLAVNGTSTIAATRCVEKTI
jgi:hypothetical protein